MRLEHAKRIAEVMSEEEHWFTTELSMEAESEEVVEMIAVFGTIVEVEQMNRNFTIHSEGEFPMLIRFNVPENALIFDVCGRMMPFAGVYPQRKVKVCHANFMTASLPPQTTAYEIYILSE